MGVVPGPGVPWHTQILADQLTLFQLGGTDYAHLITTGTPDFQTFRRPCLEEHLVVFWSIKKHTEFRKC